jgi:uncharacterized protein
VVRSGVVTGMSIHGHHSVPPMTGGLDEDRLLRFPPYGSTRAGVRLFGSAARNKLRDDSDIDLLVEFEPGRTPGLLGVAKLKLELKELLGREIDLRAVGDLSPPLP